MIKTKTSLRANEESAAIQKSLAKDGLLRREAPRNDEKGMK